jgi:hypothetical protein
VDLPPPPLLLLEAAAARQCVSLSSSSPWLWVLTPFSLLCVLFWLSFVVALLCSTFCVLSFFLSLLRGSRGRHHSLDEGRTGMLQYGVPMFTWIIVRAAPCDRGQPAILLSFAFIAITELNPVKLFRKLRVSKFKGYL